MEKYEQRKIGFVRNGTHPENLKAYQKILKDENIGVFGICLDSRERDEYDKKITKYCFEDWLRDTWDSIDIRALGSYQKKYSTYNLWEIYYTDRYIRYKYDYDGAVHVLIGMIQFWENIFENENVLCIAADCIIGAYNFLGMIVGGKYGVKYISFPTARIKKYMTYFSEKEGYDDIILKKLLDDNYIATEAEIASAENYVNTYIANKAQPFYINNPVMKPYKIFKMFKALGGRINHIPYLWNGTFNNKYSVMRYRARWAFTEPFKEKIRSRFIIKYFHDPDYKKDQYALFPLHFQPEASTCVYARKYENQLFFLEQLAKSIPAGLKIYVKEHSVRLGHRPLKFYHELEKYPNIKLIRPDESIHDLIKNSQYLVVLTSTAGFEALMYEKPVFVCGDVFYENFSGVKKIQDVFSQKEEFLNPPQQDREKYMNQMACYLKTINVCSTVEEQLKDETPDALINLQKESMKALLDYMGIENGIEYKPYYSSIC